MRRSIFRQSGKIGRFRASIIPTLFPHTIQQTKIPKDSTDSMANQTDKPANHLRPATQTSFRQVPDRQIHPTSRPARPVMAQSNDFSGGNTANGQSEIPQRAATRRYEGANGWHGHTTQWADGPYKVARRASRPGSRARGRANNPYYGREVAGRPPTVPQIFNRPPSKPQFSSTSHIRPDKKCTTRNERIRSLLKP